MDCDGASASYNRLESALNDYAYLRHVHLRLYTQRVALWQCRTEGCNEKGHHRTVDGNEIAEWFDRLKIRLQTSAKLAESEVPCPMVKPSTMPHPSPNGCRAPMRKQNDASSPSNIPRGLVGKLPQVTTGTETIPPTVGKLGRRQSLPINLETEKAEPSIARKKAYYFYDPINSEGKRFAEQGDSIEQDLESLHNRDEQKQARKRPKTPKPKQEDSERPGPSRGKKHDAAHQRQRL